jgi:hypothetical protein
VASTVYMRCVYSYDLWAILKCYNIVALLLSWNFLRLGKNLPGGVCLGGGICHLTDSPSDGPQHTY